MRISFFIGLALIALIFSAAWLEPFVYSVDPESMELTSRYEAPSWHAPFGRDENGADIMAKTLIGARTSLTVAISVVTLGLLLGLCIGTSAAWAGGSIDTLLMRVVDFIHAFPGFLLALTIVAMAGPGLAHLILALSLGGWTSYARLVRIEVLRIKQTEYVQAARALGVATPRLWLWHVWPNLLGLLFVQASFHAAGTVIAEAGLTFLGLGLPADTPTWGSLIASGRDFLDEAPHISLIAATLVITLTSALQLVGEGLRLHFSPKEFALISTR